MEETIPVPESEQQQQQIEHHHDHEQIEINHHHQQQQIEHEQIELNHHHHHQQHQQLEYAQVVEQQVEHQQALAIAVENNEPISTEQRPNKRSRKKSVVWEHFTVEPVGGGCTRACCKRCKQTFAYSSGSKVAGTSHLKRHIALGTCPVLRRRQEKDQLAMGSNPPRRRYRGSVFSPNLSFDQDRCRQEIAEMIIMHEYPLHMVEHSAFVSFVQNLQPHFNMLNFNIVQGDCVAIYLREKQELAMLLGGICGRISLSLDMWSSSQTLGYVFLTAHFVDNDWKLQRRILNVVKVASPNSEDAFSHAIGVCIGDWGLVDKVFTVTLDRSISSDEEISSLRGYLWNKNPMILNGQLLLEQCYPHLLGSMAQDGLNAIQDTVSKIRDTIKCMKTCIAFDEKFAEVKQQLQVPSTKTLFLDDQTRWDTTFLMLVAALELREVFHTMDKVTPDYNIALPDDDWKQVETVCFYLKLFFDAASILTGPTFPTSNLYFHDAGKIHLELMQAAVSDDSLARDLAVQLRDKFGQYWDHTHLILAIAVVMDPRFKMKLVEFSFNKIYGEEADTFVKVVDEGIHELFSEYMIQPHVLPTSYPELVVEGEIKTEPDSVTGVEGGNLPNGGDALNDFDVYLSEISNSQPTKSELDQYLDEALLPRAQDFDILNWWRLNNAKYPILSRMARDILAVPISTVSADSVFNNGPSRLDHYRTSLRHETLEAIICAKNWLQNSPKESLNAVVKTEY